MIVCSMKISFILYCSEQGFISHIIIIIIQNLTMLCNYTTIDSLIIIIHSVTDLEGPWLTSQLLASHPRMSSDTEVDDHAASVEVTCDQHIISPSC